MYSNGLIEKQWLRVLIDFLVDSGLFVLAFFIAVHIHIGPDWFLHLERGWPSLLIGAISISCISYIMGLYSAPTSTPGRSTFRIVLAGLLQTGIAFSGAILLTVLCFYINFSSRIGRGIMLIALPLSYTMLALHHLLIKRAHLAHFRQRVCFIINTENDENLSYLLKALANTKLEMVGLVVGNHTPTGVSWPILGTLDDISHIVRKNRLDRVICSSDTLQKDNLRNAFCTLRYSGTNVMTLLSIFEEIYQCLPIHLVTTQWLLNASGSPQMHYIRKLKRLFDVIMATVGLVVLSPALVLGMVAVRLTSRGPVIYRQKRCGRFGEVFELLKLRTMYEDAEKDGEAVWSQHNDPRVTPVGRLLRRYRIDEIPQLINVLRNEMSFVGPRPERPEFVDALADTIPYYRERLLVQTGVTGWAQVNFPYGTSVEDARRKLEYDLYYMKHMGLFLDAFILLDTCRIVFCGSVWKAPKHDFLPLLQAPENKAPTVEPSAP